MDQQYITIKEFATRAGISTQAVYKKLNKSLQPYLKIVDGKKMLNIKGLELFGKKEEYNQVEQQIVNLLQNELKQLNEELTAKNKQIEALSKALDQSQRLHAMDKQKILALEDKMQEQEPQEKKKWWQKLLR